MVTLCVTHTLLKKSIPHRLMITFCFTYIAPKNKDVQGVPKKGTKQLLSVFHTPFLEHPVSRYDTNELNDPRRGSMEHIIQFELYNVRSCKFRRISESV